MYNSGVTSPPILQRNEVNTVRVYDHADVFQNRESVIENLEEYIRFRPGIQPVLPVYCPKIEISIPDSRLWILNPGISIMGACVVINQNRDNIELVTWSAFPCQHLAHHLPVRAKGKPCTLYILRLCWRTAAQGSLGKECTLLRFLKRRCAWAHHAAGEARWR